MQQNKYDKHGKESLLRNSRKIKFHFDWLYKNNLGEIDRSQGSN